MAQPVWVTPAGSLGTIPEGVFYAIPLEANDPDHSTVYYNVIAGNLPAGMELDQTGILVGTPKATAILEGIAYPVAVDTTSKFAVRAYTQTVVDNITIINRLADRTFEITITGQVNVQFITPPGQIAEYFDGSLVPGIQIEFENPDPFDPAFIRLAAGTLPPGLSLSATGLISGFIEPNAQLNQAAGFSRDGQGYSEYPFDFSTNSNNTNYEFVLEILNTKSNALRTFSIFVWSRSDLTADDTFITADNTFVTADGTPVRVPIITTPQGSIGTVRNDNFFAFQFIGLDLDGDQFSYIAHHGDHNTEGTGIPGLTLDPKSGWLYGYIPNLGVTELVYDFTVQVFKDINPTAISVPFYYSLSITGPIDSQIVWLTPNNLGTISNGSVSTLYVEAINASGLLLQYELLSGSNSNLPQGLQLLPTGEIAGRVSFNTFALDGGTTTFDVALRNGIKAPTTFDMKHTFTVVAYSLNGVVNVEQTFSITVVREYNEPFDNLYIQAMPPQNDRELINSLIQNTDIFKPQYLYRQQDPNFGVATNVTYYHAYGLAPASIADYYSSLLENHYWKQLTLGEIKTAQALDDNGNILYEVVYSEVIDNLVNDAGVSVGKEVPLAFPVKDDTVRVVYPNSLDNMRQQVVDTVGQISNMLPRWMLSKQSNGQVLGFTPSWVIAYVKPGYSQRVAYYIKQQFGTQLNLVDFEVDRYELDNLLTKNWNRETQQWNPTPPSLTTFDETQNPDSWITNYGGTAVWTDSSLITVIWTSGTPPGTTFDQNSLQFTAPVDMYSSTTDYDKYLVFPKHNILG
jgi:Putative Ig domain